MNKKSIFITIVLALVLVFSSFSTAQALPPLPSSFFGPVRLDGALVPAGTLISARISGIEYATTLTTIYEGDSVYSINIPGDDPDTPGKDGGAPGDVVAFYLNGIAANETANWVSGTNVSLPLTFQTNHPPTAANNTVGTLEDTNMVFAAADFNFADVDTGDTLTQVQITALPAAGTLYLDNNSNNSVDAGEGITLGQVVVTADIPKLKFKPAANANGASYTTFQFKVHDGEVYSVSAYTMTINVTAVNDAPMFTKGANQTVLEDAGAQTVVGWATGIDDGDLEATQTMTFNVTGNTNPSLFSTAPAISAAGTLTYTPAANANGSATITVALSDNGGTTNGGVDTSPAQSFTITVTAVNDAPTVANIIPDQTWTGSGGKTFTFAVNTFADADGDTLAYTATYDGGALPAWLTFTPGTRTFSGNPPVSAQGVRTLVVTANDGNSGAVPDTFTLTISAANDVPTADNNTVPTPEDIDKVFAVTDFNFADVDTGDTLAQVQITTLPIKGKLYLDADSDGVVDTGEAVSVSQVVTKANVTKLKFKPVSNDFGVGYATFQFKVHDGLVYSASAYTMTIDVTSVNDAPIAFGQSLKSAEDTQKSFALFGSDIEGSPLQYEVTVEPLHGVLSGDAPNLTYTPKSDWVGTDSFKFRVYDGEAYSAEATVTITIGNNNDAPVAYDQAVSGAPGASVSITLVGNDVDNVPLTYIVTTVPLYGTLSGTAPNLTYTANANWTGSDSFQFKVDDGELESNVATVTITGPGPSFKDVPTSYWAWRHIESIYAAGITAGCGGGNYCPGTTVTRDQMAVFLMRGIKGPGYAPPPVGDSTGFKDVPVTFWAAAWIKQFALEGITAGCGGGNYCPSNAVTRDQMAVFLQRTFGLPLP